MYLFYDGLDILHSFTHYVCVSKGVLCDISPLGRGGESNHDQKHSHFYTLNVNLHVNNMAH